MKHVDALSRASSIHVVQDVIIERLHRAQERDDKIAAVKALLSRGLYRDYTIKHGLVYKGEEGSEKLVVPKGLANDLIKQAHDIGHF